MERPGRSGKIGPQEDAGASHVTLERARVAGPRIDGVEEAASARDRTIRRGLIAIVVPAGFIAAPHANTAGPNGRQKSHLIAREYQADGRGTEPLSPETGYRFQVRFDVLGCDARLSHQDVGEGVRAQLLPPGRMHRAEQLRRE